MKKITFMCALLVSALSFGQDYVIDAAATDVPVDLDGTGTSTADCATAPNLVIATVAAEDDYTIGTDMAAITGVTIDLTHTWSSDLDIFLVSPAGTELELSSDNGGSADDTYAMTLFTDGGEDITTATTPYSAGPYAPEGGTFAAAFEGETTAGDWSLKVCDDAGGDTGTIAGFSLEITVPEALSTGENNVDEFSMFPNPASNVLNVTAASTISSIKVYNLVGQVVVNQRVNALSDAIDVSNLKTGAYLIQVTAEGQTGTYKFIKQ